MSAKSEKELAVMARDIEYIKSEVKDMSGKLDSQYITRLEFDAKLNPINRIVYGTTVIVFTIIVGAIVKLVIIT